MYIDTYWGDCYSNILQLPKEEAFQQIVAYIGAARRMCSGGAWTEFNGLPGTMQTEAQCVAQAGSQKDVFS